MSAFTDKVVQICQQELQRFGNGTQREFDTAVYKRVGDYWNALALVPEYARWRGYNGRSNVRFTLLANGEVKKPVPGSHNKNQPWSAAFISFVAREAGAGGAFAYSPSHSKYIVNALKEARQPTGARFIARRHGQYTPKVGDLIACERREFDDADFDTYPSFVSAGRYEAHCDFVVAVDAGKAVTVGGNVGHSVKKKTWPLNAQGRIGDRDPGSSVAKVICIIETLL